MRRLYVAPSVVTTWTLEPKHIEELSKSRIDVATAALAGIRSVRHQDAYDFGIRGDGDLGGLLFPYWDVAEQRFSKRLVRVKPDLALARRKYLQPVGERPRLYFPAGTSVAELADLRCPIFIVEGEKKALSLARALKELGITAIAIGIGGVFSWRSSCRERLPNGTLGKGKSRPIPDLDLVRWTGRDVFLIFDSDVTTNWKVTSAETALALELRARGGSVNMIRLPGASQPKVGIDDFLVGHGPMVLPKLIEAAWRFDGHPYPEAVHLSDIEDARLGRRRVAMNLMVSAIGEAFLLPKVIDLCCAPIEPAKKKKPHLRIVRDDHDDDLSEDELDTDTTCSHCGLEGGEWQYEIRDPPHPDRLHPAELLEYGKASAGHCSTCLLERHLPPYSLASDGHVISRKPEDQTPARRDDRDGDRSHRRERKAISGKGSVLRGEARRGRRELPGHRCRSS